MINFGNDIIFVNDNILRWVYSIDISKFKMLYELRRFNPSFFLLKWIFYFYFIFFILYDLIMIISNEFNLFIYSFCYVWNNIFTNIILLSINFKMTWWMVRWVYSVIETRSCSLCLRETSFELFDITICNEIIW